MRTFHSSVVVALTLSCLVGCASESSKASKYPARQRGCEIQSFPEEPNYQTVSIGTVDALCDEADSDDACMRELKDQACKLGADTVWGVGHGPTMHLGKKRFAGRAAHQK